MKKESKWLVIGILLTFILNSEGAFAAYNLTLKDYNTTLAIINITNATNLYAYEANLDYNGTIGTVTQHNFLGSPAVATYGSSARNNILSVYGSMLNATGAGVSGSGFLFNVTHNGSLSLRYSLDVNSSGFETYSYYNNTLYCGDSVCNNGETCSTCINDCGICPGGNPPRNLTDLSLTQPQIEELIDDIDVLPNEFNIDVLEGDSVSDEIYVTSRYEQPLELAFSTENLGNAVFFEEERRLIQPKESTIVRVNFTAPENELVVGKILVRTRGVTIKEIPVVINVRSKDFLFDVFLTIPEKYKLLNIGSNLFADISLLQVGSRRQVDVTANYFLQDFEGNTYLEETETFFVLGEKQYSKEFSTRGLPAGKYILGLEILYPNAFATSSAQFEIIKKKSVLTKAKDLLKKLVLNKPLINENGSLSRTLWIILFLLAIFVVAIILAWICLRKRLKRKGKRKRR